MVWSNCDSVEEKQKHRLTLSGELVTVLRETDKRDQRWESQRHYERKSKWLGKDQCAYYKDKEQFRNDRPNCKKEEKGFSP